MKSVDFTVQRLLATTSQGSNARLPHGARSPADDQNDHVTSDEVVDNDDENASTGARNEKCDGSPLRPRMHEGRMEPLLIHPSLYLDYARRFLWQLTAAYRPG